MTLRRKIMFLGSFVLTVILVMFFTNEWNRAAFGSQGYIENGSKFGIEIGSPYLEAKQNLLVKGLVVLNISYHRKLSKTGAQNCHGHEYPDNVKLEAFHDDSWRRGVICIASKDNKVIRLSWHYAMFQP